VKKKKNYYYYYSIEGFPVETKPHQSFSTTQSFSPKCASMNKEKNEEKKKLDRSLTFQALVKTFAILPATPLLP
jgi:hypothetical protein